MIRYYRFPDLVGAGIVNNRQTLSQWIKKHGFPRPVHLGPNTAAWPAEEVDVWLRQREAERDDANTANDIVPGPISAREISTAVTPRRLEQQPPASSRGVIRHGG